MEGMLGNDLLLFDGLETFKHPVPDKTIQAEIRLSSW